jgi:hypothetical protein
MIMYNSFVFVTIICCTIFNYPHAISSTVITNHRNNLIDYTNNNYYLSMIHRLGIQTQSLSICPLDGSSISHECCADVNYWLASIADYANATTQLATCTDSDCIDKYSKIIGNNLFAIQGESSIVTIISGCL